MDFIFAHAHPRPCVFSVDVILKKILNKIEIRNLEDHLFLGNVGCQYLVSFIFKLPLVSYECTKGRLLFGNLSHGKHVSQSVFLFLDIG